MPAAREAVMKGLKPAILADLETVWRDRLA